MINKNKEEDVKDIINNLGILFGFIFAKDEVFTHYINMLTIRLLDKKSKNANIERSLIYSFIGVLGENKDLKKAL